MLPRTIKRTSLLLLLSLAASAGWGQGAGMSRRVYEALQQVQQLDEQKRHDEAIRKLQDIQRGKLTDYEAAQVLNMLGYAYFNAEDYDRALQSFESLLGQKGLPDEMVGVTLKTACQLSLAVERYREAIAYCERLEDVRQEPDVLMLLAQARYGLEEFDQALALSRQALAVLEERQRTPPENLYLLLNAIHYERNDIAGMEAVLRELVRRYPRDRYVLNLAGIYGQMDKTREQLLLMEPLYETGGITNPAHILSLANLYLLHEVPYKGAQLLSREIADGRVAADERNLELQAQAWELAGHATEALQARQQAAKVGGSGESHLRLAHSYSKLERWQEVAAAAREALHKGGLRRPGEAHLLVGMAELSLGHHDAAAAAFRHAMDKPESAELARQWLQYTLQERERFQLAAQSR